MRKSNGEDFYCRNEILFEAMDKFYADPKNYKFRPPLGVLSLDQLVGLGSSSYYASNSDVSKPLHDWLGQTILSTILEYGGSANLQEIAEQTSRTPDQIFDWIRANKERVKGLKKLSPGRYAYRPPEERSSAV